MTRSNKYMKDMLDKLNLQREEFIKVNPSKLSKILLPRFKEVYDCIIIDMNNEIKQENINFEKILSMFGDKTGYEASCNEIRLNDYIEYSDELAIIQLGKMIMDAWEYKLKAEFPKYKFCIILSFHEGYVTLRFHTIRKDENSWLEENLEGYKQEAILIQEF